MLKTIKTVLISSLLFSFVLLISGCGELDIKDTSGIRDYLVTQARCELLAIRIKRDFAGTPQYLQAEAAYNTAAAYGNGYMAALIVEIKTSHTVNVSEESFTRSDVYAKMQNFLTFETLSFPKPKVTPAAPAGKKEKFVAEEFVAESKAVVEVVKEVIGIYTSWQDRVEKETDAKLKVLEEEWFSRVYWNSFDRTTEDSFNMKWTRSFQPTEMVHSTKEAGTSK